MFPIIIIDIEGPITAVAADFTFVIFAAAACEVIDCELATLSHSTSAPARTVARFDRVALAQAASPAPPRAARIVPRAVAAPRLFYILLEDASLLLSIIIVHVVGTVVPVPRDAPWIETTPSAIPRLDPIADAHSPAAPVAVVTLPLLVATPGVLSFDVLLEDASLLLAIVICVWTNRETRRVEA